MSKTTLNKIFETLNNKARKKRASCTERNNWEGYSLAYERFENEAKQAILDWHNKQVEAKLAHMSEYAESVISINENGEFSMKAIPLSLVAVERNKLKESKNDQL